MRVAIQIRCWRQVGLSSLLGLALQGFAIGQTPTPPATPAPAAPAQPHHTSTSTHKKSSHGKKTSKKRGQKEIDSDRAREIQTALIREHYLQGEPTGKWDAATQAAMHRYQADQGWQSKQIPDSRALIKLGLGPSHDHLLNPESAMTTTTTTTTAPPAAADPKAGAKPALPDNNLPKQ
ncbi:MAG TPA: peptidoglycan-binding domain-containing protein [Terriglobales bacterium]|nr:peptidoglycan-binding domain-containing protein [Terriglobales bacterium]